MIAELEQPKIIEIQEDLQNLKTGDIIQSKSRFYVCSRVDPSAFARGIPLVASSIEKKDIPIRHLELLNQYLPSLYTRIFRDSIRVQRLASFYADIEGRPITAWENWQYGDDLPNSRYGIKMGEYKFADKLLRRFGL